MRHRAFVPIVVFLAAVMLAEPASTRAEPAGFSLVTVAAGLDQPTAFAFKGAKILVTEKASGKVQVVRRRRHRCARRRTSRCSVSARVGARACSASPSTRISRRTAFVYVYYTTGPGAVGYTGSPKNRVSRFTTGRGSSARARPSSSTTFRPTTGITTAATSSSASTASCTSRSATAARSSRCPHPRHAARQDPARQPATATARPTTRTSSTPGARRCGGPAGVPPGTGPCKEIYAYGLAQSVSHVAPAVERQLSSSATSARARGRS